MRAIMAWMGEELRDDDQAVYRRTSARTIGMRHPCRPWLLEWCAQLVYMRRVEHERRTGTERPPGNLSHKTPCMLGECIAWQPLKPRGHDIGELEPRSYDGIRLGVGTRTDEDIVGTYNGATRARSIKRLPDGQRRDAPVFRTTRGTPRQPAPGSGSSRLPARPGQPGDDGDDDDDG